MELTQVVSSGVHPARMITRARVLPALHESQGDTPDRRVVAERVGTSEITVYPHEPLEPLGAGAPACRCHPKWCHGIRRVPQHFSLGSTHVFRSQNVEERGPAESSVRGVRPRTRHRHGLDRWVLADRR